MANEELFASKAVNYAKGRKSYAPEAVTYMQEHLLRDKGAVADIGSGTGILSREFIERGIETYCVEPNQAMAAEAEMLLGEYPNYHPVSASAEATQLENGSVSLVVAASAFHWFDAEPFKEECKRILRKGGYVCILLNARVYDAFTEMQHALCEKYCRRFRSFAHGLDKTLGKMEDFFGADYEVREFEFPLDYTKEQFLDRSLSSSYALEESDPDYGIFVEELKQLMDQWFEGNRMTIANKTIMIVGQVSQ